ncbi:DUF983 domain-containing protein [Ancylobacter pratisalsi]|uniref:DUF983 domain-containing protein n=1 Tax=Ancylobacter pratisalsi TaxID=1745854 RepID=A0A6P1YG92_9HYPH|nr:DUF983 domain-containing protein [Ancylobacter pratisalsi]QIB32317.1 DUF983 domain-containing protein [Ancylobacter pratisalsi]
MMSQPHRPVGTAFARGFRMRCPACGQGKMFGAYLKVNERCPSCGEELWHHRADDAPPYMVITIVGHIVVPLLLAVEMAFRPAIWIHLSLWLPMTLILSLLLLPPVKGALIAYQWAVRMHGFDPTDPERDPVPPSRRADAPMAKPARVAS